MHGFIPFHGKNEEKTLPPPSGLFCSIAPTLGYTFRSFCCANQCFNCSAFLIN